MVDDAKEIVGKLTKADVELLNWPEGVGFSFVDEPGEHDPCYIVMPGGCSLPVNHDCRPGVDIARAKWIIDACNEKLAGSALRLDDVLAVIAEQKAVFASEEYATGQPLSSFQERFACDQIAEAVRALLHKEQCDG